MMFGRRHHQQRVDRQPELMLAEIPGQLLARDIDRIGFGDVVRIQQCRGVMTPKVPEQPLLGNALGNPPPRPAFHTQHPPTVGARGMALPPVAFSFRQHQVKAMLHQPEDPDGVQLKAEPGKESRRRRFVGRIVMGLRLVHVLAIQLVCVGTDRNQEDVHQIDLR
jgi:hypothetical protein